MIGYKVLTSKGLKGPFMKSSLVKAITSAMVPLQARVLELETNRYMYAADLVGEKIDPKDPTLRMSEDDRTIAVKAFANAPDDRTMAMSPEEILNATKDKLSKEEFSKAEKMIAQMADDKTMAMSPEEILAATKDKLKASKQSKAEKAIAQMADDRTMAMSPEEILAATKDKLNKARKSEPKKAKRPAPKPKLEEPEELRLDEDTPGDIDTPRVMLRLNPALKKNARLPKPRKLTEKSEEKELDTSAA